MTNKIAQQNQERPIDILRRQIEQASQHFVALAKTKDEADRSRLVAEIIQVCKANPKLLLADRGSLFLAIGEAVAQGMSLNPLLGEAWLIPRNRRVKIGEKWESVLMVDFQPGYKGLVKLAYRSNVVDRIYTNVVYQGEKYIERGGLRPDIEHEIDHTKRTGKQENVLIAYAMADIRGGSHPPFESLGRHELMRIAESSGDPRKKEWSDVWTEHFVPMARKSAMIRLAKWLPRSDDLRQFHVAVERESMREAGKMPERMDELDGIRLPSADGSRLEELIHALPSTDEQDGEETQGEP